MGGQAALKKGRKRARVLVDKSNEQGGSRELNEFEKEREERLARNKARLEGLGLDGSAAAFARLPAAGSEQPAKRRKRDSPAEGGVRRPPRPAAAAGPTRVSARRRGLAPTERWDRAAAGEAPGVSAAEPGEEGAQREEGEQGPRLVPLEEYFKGSSGAEEAIVVDGRYRGWVSEDVRQRYGIAENSEAAWEAGGGGKFSFKIDKASIPAALKAKGWSDARAFAATQLKANPNSYFYRHVAPDEAQAQGEWTEEEHAAFMRVVRAWGVGDKWGLFASHLRNRVGYQCSAYYREVVLARGLVYDPRFRISPAGRVVFVG